MVLVCILWLQTGFFSEPIREYRFGADGWPRAVLLFLAVGATLQMVSGLRSVSLPVLPVAAGNRAGWLQRLGIFCLPLIYLWAMRRVGFFVATPVFIVAYLYILEVRRWLPLLAVTGGLCAVMWVIFVRFFYVALPVGSWPLFYDLNNAIIGIIRIGLHG